MKPAGAKIDRPNFLILGLGNIGPEYYQSRHNIGFDVVDALAERLKLRFIPGKGEFYVSEANKPGSTSWWRGFLGLSSETVSDGQAESPPVLLFKPTTFMNRSGEAAKQILERYDYPPEKMLVITDDFHLDLGSVRLRQSGSDGGHNGLASIIRSLGSDNFPRLRVGIGPKPQSADIIKFVLSQFGPPESDSRTTAIDHATSACLYLLRTESENSLAMAMSKYNIVAPDPAPGSGVDEASQKEE